MGTCSKAALAWGFEIPSEKLHALLECFRKHAQAEDASNANSQETTDESGEDDSVKGGDQDNTTGEESVLGARTAKEREGGAKKRKVALNSEDAEDLYFSFLDEVRGRFQRHFKLIFTGLHYDDGDQDPIRLAFAYQRPFECDRWGNYANGTSLKTLGPDISSDGMKLEGWEKVLKELEIAMHLEEAGVELPLKEEWLLYIDIG